MSREVRREVKGTERFLDQLDSYYGEGSGRPPVHEVLNREVFPYVFEMIRESWDDLQRVADDARVRFYVYPGDLIPFGLFTVKLVALSVPDPFYLVEHLEVIDVVISFDDEPLEDPEDQTPDR